MMTDVLLLNSANSLTKSVGGKFQGNTLDRLPRLLDIHRIIRQDDDDRRSAIEFSELFDKVRWWEVPREHIM